MTRLNWTVGIVCALALLAGCGPEQTLTGEWSQVRTDSRVGDGEWQDVTDPCDADDIEAYDSDGEYSYYVGEQHCSDSESDLYGTWELDEDDPNTVRYTYDRYEGSYISEIRYLQGDDLVLSWHAGDTADTQYRVILKRHK